MVAPSAGWRVESAPADALAPVLHCGDPERSDPENGVYFGPCTAMPVAPSGVVSFVESPVVLTLDGGQP